MSGNDITILTEAALAVAGVAAITHCLRPVQRVVVLMGALAAVVQVYYPPCLGVGRPPYYLSEPAGRHLFPSSYCPSDSGFWIDADRLHFELLVTVVATAIGCALLLPCRCRVVQSPLANNGPTP